MGGVSAVQTEMWAVLAVGMASATLIAEVTEITEVMEITEITEITEIRA